MADSQRESTDETRHALRTVLLVGALDVLHVALVLPDDVRERAPPDVAADAPRGEDVPLREDGLDLLERAVGGLGEHEEDVHRGEHVERAEDEVRDEALRGEGGQRARAGAGRAGDDTRCWRAPGARRMRARC